MCCAVVFGCKTNGVQVKTAEGTLVVTPMTDNAVRVQMEGKPTHDVEELIFTEEVPAPEYTTEENDQALTIQMKGMKVVFDKKSQTFAFYDKDGKLLLQEKPGTRSMKESTIMGDPTYEVSQSWISAPGDHQFGTGQFQDGILDIMGLSRRLTQNNTQIVSPVIVSSNGYGLLWHNYGHTEFNYADNRMTLKLRPSEAPSPAAAVADPAADVPAPVALAASMNRRAAAPKYYDGEFTVTEAGKYAVQIDVGKRANRGHKIVIDGQVVSEDTNSWAPTLAAFVELQPGKHVVEAQGALDETCGFCWRKVDESTSFYSPVAQGLDYTVFAGTPDEVIASYRELTGPVPHMQPWAFGYIHCRERYNTQAELLENAHGFVDRNIPVSMIVQDWQWWGDTGWNSLTFDKAKYPDPNAMVKEVHDLGIKIMISVWSRVEHATLVGDALEEKGYFIPETEWIDFFNPEASQFYWECVRDSMVRRGFDAWWFDATEPDNDYELLDRRVNNNTIPGAVYRNVYPLVMNRAMYNGFKEDNPDNMPVVLTRSAFTGSQRYGVITWSGDISHDWGTFRKQIIGGLGQSTVGIPWWTCDDGGFSRPSDQYTNTDYQERLIRWIQASVFFPFMRVHGSGSHTEPWNYLPETQRLFEKAIALRYELQPYILEVSRKVSEEGYTMMRPLVFDFANDEEALAQDTEFMFGPDYLVCPVLESGVTSWKVYLPKNAAGWDDFRDGTHYDGGQYVEVPVDMEAIPVFKKL